MSIASHQFCSLENNAFKLVHVADRRNIESVKFNNASGSGICVEVQPDSSEFKYKTLITPATFTLENALTLIYRAGNETAVPTSTATVTRYSFGMNIPTQSGYFTIPKPGPFGTCENNYRVQLAVNEKSKTCSRRLTTALCNNNDRFSLTPYTTLQYVKQMSASSTYSNAFLFALYTVDATTKSRTYDASPSTPTTSLTGSICSNVVTGINYYVDLSTDGASINEIYIVATVTDITIPASGSIDVPQSVSVQFVASTTQIGVTGQTSGNPGYIIGSPLRIGNRTTNNAVQITNLNYYPNGIDANGLCITTGTSAMQKTINFGQDSSYSCSYTFASTNLQSFCEGGWRDLLLWNNFVPDPTNSGDSGMTYIGIFGNSDPLNMRDFLRVRGTEIEDVNFVYADGRCEMLTRSTLTIYWSTVGYYEAPQPYVVAARINFDNNRTVIAPADTTQDISVGLTLNVRYVRTDTVNAEYTSGNRPSIIPQLPSDILYPLFYPTEESAIFLTNKFSILAFVVLLITLL